MANGNTVTLVGNITRDPELRYTPQGRSNVAFGIAVNRRYQDRNGEWQESTSFFNVVAWGDLAENVSESLARGSRVIVTGRLEQRSWETQEGEKKSVIEVVADEVAPSLRWATAKIEKNDRRSADGPSGGGATASRTTRAAAEPAYDDEEPF
jgi:single-strand DNA-binding protein